jgi:hypothetical protein
MSIEERTKRAAAITTIIEHLAGAPAPAESLEELLESLNELSNFELRLSKNGNWVAEHRIEFEKREPLIFTGVDQNPIEAINKLWKFIEGKKFRPQDAPLKSKSSDATIEAMAKEIVDFYTADNGGNVHDDLETIAIIRKFLTKEKV